MKRFPQVNRIKLLSLGFCSVLFLMLSSCLNDIDEVVTTVERPEPAVLENYDPIDRPVNASVVVFVVDKDGDPVPGVELSIGANNGTTDAYGHYFLNDVSLNARGSLVRAFMPGYFDGSRRFFPVAGERSFVKIELIDKIFDQEFNAASGGTVILPGGASIQFSGNTISKSDGGVYTGEVRVAAEWLDPAQANTYDRMPGNLQGVNYFNEEVALATYGMMAVELTSPAGDPLNIKEGEAAILTMPVPAEMLGQAPSTIPLWSYYEPLGIWVIESEAVLQDGKYIGPVSHFSFWNCDYPYPLVEFQAQLVDTAGNPLVNHQVSIVLDNSGGSGSGYTNANGLVSGLVPANVEMEIQVLNVCGEVVYTMNIGPFSNDVDLGQITIPPGTGVNATTITGELLDCDSQPLENGLVIAEYNGQTVYLYPESSTFEMTLTSCSGLNEVVVTGIDLSSFIQSDPLVVNPNTQTDLGPISVCDQQLQNYIIIESGGITALYTPAVVRIDSSNVPGNDTVWTSISASGTNPAGTEYYIYMAFESTGVPGDYSNANFLEVLFDFDNGWSFQGGSFSQFDVTEYGEPGEAIEGSFSGAFQGTGGLTSVSGSFNVIR